MLEKSWITAILRLYSQVTDPFGNVIVNRINIRLFDLLARCHYILNAPRTFNYLWILMPFAIRNKCLIEYSLDPIDHHFL